RVSVVNSFLPARHILNKRGADPNEHSWAVRGPHETSRGHAIGRRGDGGSGDKGKQEKSPMVCSMVKKGVVGAALTAGALYLVFGTSAPSYVRTAFHKVRQNARDAVSIQFEIDRTRGEIANLEPAIKDNIEVLARGLSDVEYLEREIVTVQDNLAVE